jgi:hypothetical protein
MDRTMRFSHFPLESEDVWYGDPRYPGGLGGPRIEQGYQAEQWQIREWDLLELGFDVAEALDEENDETFTRNCPQARSEGWSYRHDHIRDLCERAGHNPEPHGT